MEGDQLNDSEEGHQQ